MSQSLRTLKAAVREFVNRPTEEEIDVNELRDVVDELDGELEKLYESPEERAAADAAGLAYPRGLPKRSADTT